MGLALVGILVGTTAAGAHLRGSAGDVAAGERIPLLIYTQSLTPERDMPAIVRARLEREYRRRLELARRAQREPASQANGCVPNEFGSLGSPAPRVTPRVLGYHVEVLVELNPFPKALSCRPWRLRVYVHSGDRKLNFDSSFGVERPRGRIVVNLPLFGHPPYRLKVESESFLGRTGPSVEISLRCPGIGHRVKGCLAGLTSLSGPRPGLPLRGVTLPALRASFAYLLEAERRPPILKATPTGFRCSSLRTCEVTYVDRAFPDSPFRVRYGISGQQVPGCWMGVHRGETGQRPYEDAGGGMRTLAACASWVR